MIEADVVIVGAGAAGLYAARRLAETTRYRIVLIEARDRVGGRVWSQERMPGVWGEMGAEFIHGTAHLTHKILHEAGLSTDEMDGEQWVLDANGELHRNDEEFESDTDLFDALSAAQDVSVADYFARFVGDETKARRIKHALLFIEGFDAADPRVAGAQGIAAEWRSGANETDARPHSSYHAMFEHLHRTCVEKGVQSLLSTRAKTVRWNARRVEVEVALASGKHDVVRARYGIVTLPASLLKDGQGPRFEPALPPEKQQSLETIVMGRVVKVSLWFRTRFWEEIAGGKFRDAAFFRVDDREVSPFGVFWTRLSQRTNVITAWSAGPRSEPLKSLDERVVVEHALNCFGAILSAEEAVRREFVDGAAHDWSNDEFSCGAYSYLAVGARNARRTLAEPLPPLFFAGEATATNGQSGTVNGALETGERAAGEVRAFDA